MRELLVKVKYKALDYIRTYYDDLLMMLGFVLTFFLVINCIRLFGEMEMVSKGERSFSNEYIAEYTMNEEEIQNIDIEKLISLLQKYQVNVFLENCYVARGDLLEYMPVSVCISSSLGIEFSLEKGKVLKLMGEDNIDGEILIGKSLEEYVQIKENKEYITLGGQEFLVGGVLNYVGIDDESVYILWEQLNENQKKNLITEIESYCLNYNNVNLQIAMQSDTSLDAIYQELSEKISANLYGQIQVADEKEDRDVFDSARKKINVMLSVILLVFSLISCIVISDLWFSRRKKEFLIRKAFGYNMRQIAVLLIKEIGRMSLVSLLVSIPMQMIYSFCKHYGTTDMITSIIQIFALLIGVLAVDGIVMIRPYLKISKLNPSQNIIDSAE